jgi:hypothetical protein
MHIFSLLHLYFKNILEKSSHFIQILNYFKRFYFTNEELAFKVHNNKRNVLSKNVKKEKKLCHSNVDNRNEWVTKKIENNTLTIKKTMSNMNMHFSVYIMNALILF